MLLELSGKSTRNVALKSVGEQEVERHVQSPHATHAGFGFLRLLFNALSVLPAAKIVDGEAYKS